MAKKQKKIVKPVLKDSLNNSALKYALIYLGINHNEIGDKLLKGYKLDDEINIYELTRILERVTREDKLECERIARFIIEEPLNNNEWEFNELMANHLNDVVRKLENFLQKYLIPQENQVTNIMTSIFKVTFNKCCRN